MITKIRSHRKPILVLIGCITVGLIVGLMATKTYANVHEAQSIAPNQVLNAGVTMSIMKGAIGEGTTKATACFDLPSNADWFPEGVLTDGTSTIEPQQIVLLNWKDPQILAGKHRCYEFTFAANVSPTAKLTVKKLQISVPENLTQADCNRAVSKVKQRAENLSFSCLIDKHGVTIKVDNRPKEMTSDQVNTWIQEALTETTEGPWELPIIK